MNINIEMSQYKVLPSYTDLTTLTDDLHQAGPVLCHAQVGGDRLVDLDHDLQVQTVISFCRRGIILIRQQ